MNKSKPKSHKLARLLLIGWKLTLLHGLHLNEGFFPLLSHLLLQQSLFTAQVIPPSKHPVVGAGVGGGVGAEVPEGGWTGGFVGGPPDVGQSAIQHLGGFLPPPQVSFGDVHTSSSNEPLMQISAGSFLAQMYFFTVPEVGGEVGDFVGL